MSKKIVDTPSVEVFLKSWNLYQEIIANNYMFHREISAAVQPQFLNFKADQSIRVIDLGSGDSSMVLPMLKPEKISSYIGCDLSQPALTIAQKTLDERLISHQLICDDMLNVITELPASSADIIFSSYALHHLNSTQKTKIINEISRVLAPEGRFILIDVFREASEDRAAYMRNYMSTLKREWVKLTPEAQTRIIEHATEFDFPEHAKFYQTTCRNAGLCDGIQFAKHTWHEVFVFNKLY